MIYVGIDPGFDGAICTLGDGGVREITFIDMPTIVVREKPTKRREYDMHELSRILCEFTYPKHMVMLERQQPMPAFGKGGKERKGTITSFHQGLGYGMFQALLIAHKIPYEVVMPVTWKRLLMPGMAGASKRASCTAASRLFPTAADRLTRLKDNGRADALLIAAYAQRRNDALRTSVS